jgi:hypothetical protein
VQDPSSTVGVSKAAQDLGLTPQGVRDLIRSGKLEARKNEADRWRIDGDSLARYLSEHGPKEGALSALDRLDRRVSELDRRIESLSESASALTTVENERDRFRSDASALRDALLLYIASAADVEAAFQKQRDAFAQLVRPGLIQDLMSVRAGGQSH